MEYSLKLFDTTLLKYTIKSYSVDPENASYGSSIRSSPFAILEFTANGLLPKCCHRIDDKTYLYKGGTTVAPNTDNEPYS